MANGDETFIGAIDQGTSSTRFLIFNSKTQEVVASHQVIFNWLIDGATGHRINELENGPSSYRQKGIYFE